MKKAVCISCTHHYTERTSHIEAVLRGQGYEITYITSDFSHTAKQHYTVELPHCIQIPTRPYYKNISPQRLHSHLQFSRDALAKVEALAPELLYVEVPPNSLSRAAAGYKKRHPEVKLIFDIFDMWPESFPSSKAKKLLALPFGVWARFRNCGLKAADVVLTECDLFAQKLRKHLKDTKQKTLYLCHVGATKSEAVPLPAQEALHLCYLGSINNIIDIPAIAALLSEIRRLRPVVLHIIGDGETREELIAAAQAAGTKVEFHGKIYDASQKQAIFDKCSFGLNIMKDSVFIGLTMKSLDYFAAGLPILNSIGGDTRDLVECRGVGFNLNREDPAATAALAAAVSPETQCEMSARTLEMFRELFTEEVFAKNLLSVL